MEGYTGRILRIELSRKKFTIQPFGEDFAKKFLGGDGFAAKILYDERKPGGNPFAPQNRVVLKS
jgi:aldehyde:ferredoxin oxidoreductase